MDRDWQNPHYDYYRQQQKRLIWALAAFLLIAGVVVAMLLRRGPATADATGPSATGQQPPHTVSAPRQVAQVETTATGSADDPVQAPLSLTRPGPMVRESRPAATGGAATFADSKALAFSLYRQNDLPGAQEQAQAALALRRDEELIELLLKLRREIRVQRNYDNARTAHFAVLFDGYEHEEMKVVVLDILKDAYAEIGKELAHFPEEPITVILYTGKDFSDVTRAPGWAGGMFGMSDGKIRLPVQGAAGQERMLRRVVTHEYVHALLHSLAPSTPLWLHEGLAQYLSGDRAVNVAQVIPLPMLAGGFPRDARAAYAAYMVSLQAVSDLVDERGMPPLRRLLNEMGAGKGMEEAFTAAYGEPFSRWAAGWRPAEGRDVEATTRDAGEEDG